MESDSELLDSKFSVRQTVSDLIRRRKFYNHMPSLIRHRLGGKKFDSYYKFCVERDYLSKSVSHYYMTEHLGRCCDIDEYVKAGNFCLNYPLYCEDDKVLVDQLIDYSDLESGLSAAMGHLGLSVELKRSAKSNITRQREIFNSQQMKVLEEAFYKESLIVATVDKR